MSLLSLPNEILLEIASSLNGDAKTLSYLLLANHRLHLLLAHLLHRLAIEDTDLHWAASRGRAPLVLLLLEKGVDINLQDGCGNTALIKAIEFSHTEVVRIPLENSADIRIHPNYFWSSCSLEIALQNRYFPIIELLVEHITTIWPPEQETRDMMSKELYDWTQPSLEGLVGYFHLYEHYTKTVVMYGFKDLGIGYCPYYQRVFNKKGVSLRVRKG